VKVALGQTIGTPGDVVANLALMKRLAGEAAAHVADMLLLPELFLTGYNVGAVIRDLAESAGGSSARAAAAIAERAGIAIAFGYPERAAAGIYNSAMLLDRAGRQVANYRKTHLWGEYERSQFLPGEWTEPFDFGGIRAALLICYDLELPEMVRSVALRGADAILVLSATSEPYPIVPRHIVPARAYENGVFVLFSNHAGEEMGLRYCGASCAAAPDGSILAACGEGEGLAFATVDPAGYADYRRDHDHKAHRRPELYAI